METVHKTLDILETFLKQPEEMGIVELSNLSGVNISTAHRIALDLTNRGYLKKKPNRGKYSIGIKLLEYYGIIQSNLKIGEIALPYLQKLSQLCGEYSEVAVLESNSAMTITQVETSHTLTIRNEIGERLPLHATSLGKLFLAYMKENDRKAFFTDGKLHPFTTNTFIDIDRLEEEIQPIKRQGFAIDNEEYDRGIWSVAAPIFDAGQSMAAGLAIAAPSIRMDDSKRGELIEMAKIYAMEISREIGYVGIMSG